MFWIEKIAGATNHNMVLSLAIGPLGCREGKVGEHEVGRDYIR